MQVTAYIATSLDGFIARVNGDLDWLPADGGVSADEDYGYKAFMKTVDALVMGRHTYEKVLTFGTWPYEKPVFLLASRPVAVPPELKGSVEQLFGMPHEILAQLSARGLNHVYVDGGKTIQQFLDAGTVQRLILTRIPVLIGTGIPLFGPVSRDIRLRHIETRTYSSGLIQSEYVVAV